VYPERLTRFFTALTHELRRRGVTTLFTAETHNLYDPTLEVPIRDLSAVVENIVFLRYVQDAHRLTRVISILKLRESSHDPTVRPFTISDTGIHLAAADDMPHDAPARRRRGR
jgi:circadian clock protein KaiC